MPDKRQKNHFEREGMDCRAELVLVAKAAMLVAFGVYKCCQAMHDELRRGLDRGPATPQPPQPPPAPANIKR